MNFLIIPDYHALPDVDNDRAIALGEYIAHRQPDVLVCLGDWWDYPSLCKWSKKSELEGSRFVRDGDAGKEAMELMMEPIRARKRKLPRMEFLEGNHETRPHDFCKDRPEFTGMLEGPRAFVESHGWTWNSFGDVVKDGLNGWHFTHYFPSGIMGKAVGGLHVGNSLINTQKVSCVQGHNHIFDAKVVNNGDGAPIHGITAGCFIHPTNVEGWNRTVRHMYHRGVLELPGGGKAPPLGVEDIL